MVEVTYKQLFDALLDLCLLGVILFAWSTISNISDCISMTCYCIVIIVFHRVSLRTEYYNKEINYFLDEVSWWK